MGSSGDDAGPFAVLVADLVTSVVGNGLKFGLILLVVGFVFGRLVSRLVQKVLEYQAPTDVTPIHRTFEHARSVLAGTVVSVGFYIAAVWVGFVQIGLDMQMFMYQIVNLTFGLAFSNPLSKFLAGMEITMDLKLKPDDRVSISSVLGGQILLVRRCGAQNVVCTVDVEGGGMRVVVVPNTVFVQQPVVWHSVDKLVASQVIHRHQQQNHHHQQQQQQYHENAETSAHSHRYGSSDDIHDIDGDGAFFVSTGESYGPRYRGSSNQISKDAATIVAMQQAQNQGTKT